LDIFNEAENFSSFFSRQRIRPWGSKFKVLAKIANNHGAQVMSVDYRKQANGEDVDQNAAGEADRRVAYLLATTLPDHDRLILVGSSMGGYVSTVASATLKPDGLFLLARHFI
jgi:acetyl esterase/lipase